VAVDNVWDLTVSSKHKLLDFNLREIVRYRDLILMFFVRNFATIYKQTILGPHIDTPVKRYSSGMYIRLGFAIAAHLECEMMIADEALAVGDVGFQ
jgi:ABC-type polysaccharide/polyol phosphate transport system ATPase subunit